MSKSVNKLVDLDSDIQDMEIPSNPEKYFHDLLRAEILEASYQFESSILQNDKDYLRSLHVFAKREAKDFDAAKLQALFKKHKKIFKTGQDIIPAKIKPVLKLVEKGDDESNEIFRLVRSSWSMPYNKGYGRRLRFIVYDEEHDGVIGIIGLQSPPADLSSRDKLFAYPDSKKLDLVNSTMDAFTVGAIPPYSNILGGKLCAGLISTDPIRQAYWRRYASEKTWMNNQSIQQPLVAVTTTGAFGRSSMYNRLKFQDRLLAKPIGYTMGFGTLHLEHLYDLISRYLKVSKNFKVGGFGSGPKVRWQNIANILTTLQLPSNILKHGIKREVFLFDFVEDLASGMAGGSFGTPISMSVDEYSTYWKERWACPRALRNVGWATEDHAEKFRLSLL